MTELPFPDHESCGAGATDTGSGKPPAPTTLPGQAWQVVGPSATPADAPVGAAGAESPQSTDGPQTKPRWQPLRAIERRVVGVLAEKAKTVPDAYPMSLNAICTGCNQKSNRDPLMQLEPADVEEALERLRAIGAVGMVEGYGRVTKYRHYLYEWLGVDKVELAVMTELLLRGPQTLGELRARASRMEPIADLAAVRSICESLKRKGLVVYLTPEGRGQIVTHALYPPRELDNLRARYAAGRAGALDDHAAQAEESPVGGTAEQAPADSEQPLARSAAASAELQAQLRELNGALEQLRGQVQELADRLGKLESDVQSLKNQLEG